MAASHLDAAGAQGVGRKIEHGRGDHAHINHLHAGRHQPAHERCAQGGSTQAAIAPDSHCAFTLFERHGAKSTPQRLGHGLVNGGGHDAPDVIGFENGRGQLHGNNSLLKGVFFRQTEGLVP